ncbi:MAG: ChpI protein [Acidimicrobiaceae bacterium]|nr:ChpI protein [Acidimicrobiaceae bacterium]
MKTAVSIPDALFEAADALARERRMSRSALYAEALALLLSTRNDDVTERLDAVYADESSSIDPTVERANVGLAAEPW